MASTRKPAKRAPKQDDEREERIHMEIIVDCYGTEERAMGWYYFMEERLHFPFTARCITERATSPLEAGKKGEVVDLLSPDECEHEVFVSIRTEGKRTLAVPLAQLSPVKADEETREAIADWHYWVNSGYEY
jgi:hypothetical protein